MPHPRGSILPDSTVGWRTLRRFMSFERGGLLFRGADVSVHRAVFAPAHVCRLTVETPTICRLPVDAKNFIRFPKLFFTVCNSYLSIVLACDEKTKSLTSLFRPHSSRPERYPPSAVPVALFFRPKRMNQFCTALTTFEPFFHPRFSNDTHPEADFNGNSAMHHHLSYI